MSRERNPFLYSPNPYRGNPFTILELPRTASLATIEEMARTRELEIAGGAGGVAGDPLRPGDARRAAESLQDPVVRLTFDLMTPDQPEAERDS